MKPLKLNYLDIMSQAAPVPSVSAEGITHWTASSSEWGSFGERYFRHNHVEVREVVTAFERDCQLSVHDAGLPDSVSISIPLTGCVAANYCTCDLFTELRPKRHHHIYVPASQYDWLLSRKSRVVHVRIDRDYFTALLSDAEPWSAALREKLLRREKTHSRQGIVCAGMQRILVDILSTPMTGHLRNIFMEAKVLELIALQLHHSKMEHGDSAPFTLKKKDKEILAVIHDHLTEHFGGDYSLQALSKVYGLNEFILKKGFKTLYGKTIFEYLFELRMDHARHMLMEEGKMVCEAAREVGYKNPNHFSTAFKKKFGVNPLLLRRYR